MSSKKHIIVTVTNDLHVEQRMIRSCTALYEAGYEVTLVGRLKVSSNTLTNQPFTQVRLPMKSEKGKLFYLEYNYKLLRWLKNQTYDLIIAVDLDTILPALWASHFREIPVFYDAHEYFTETPEVVRRPVIQKMWAAIAHYAIPKVDFRYTVGPKLAEVFTAHYKLDFEVLKNVPFLRSKQKAILFPKKPYRLLYQGALNEGRGLEELVRAMRLLPDFELDLIGSGDLDDSLRVLTASFSEEIQSRIHFHGFIDPAELWKYTLKGDLGISILEHKGMSYYYSMPNKNFDYIQAGLPSLLIDFPEYRKLVENHGVGYLVPDLEPENLAKAIKTVFSDKEKYLGTMGNCHEAAQVLNWEQEKGKLIQWVEHFLKD